MKTVNQLNWRRTARPSRQSSTRKAKACATLTWPAGMGRSLVRSTRPSKLRSAMSLSVQPAPRMMMAPIRNSARMPGVRQAAARGDLAQRQPPPAGDEQQPPADGPFQPHEPRIGAKPRRQHAVCPMARQGVGDAAVWALRGAAGIDHGRGVHQEPHEDHPSPPPRRRACRRARNRACARAGALPHRRAAAWPGRSRLGVQRA